MTLRFASLASGSKGNCDGRAAESADFSYLRGQIAVTDGERARKSVSLNLAHRQAERERERAERLERKLGTFSGTLK